MNREQIIETIIMLANSQGFYSRLYKALCEAKEEYRECFLERLVEQNFKDAVDLVSYFEN